MANHLDLEEQEQLDQLKHFWKQYGNWITWGLIVVLGAVAAWNGFQLWQRNQSTQAAAMFDEVEKVTKAGDPQKAERAFSDMKERFASTVYTQQAGLLVAKMNYEAGKPEVSKGILRWLVDHAVDKGYASIARLRLSALLIDSKSYDEALGVLGSGMSDEFSALVDDRRGDIFVLQGKNTDAKTAYLKAYTAFESQSEYRRLVGIKLSALGVKLESTDKSVAATGVIK
jgi:predicted negative regulator of RcsB-dependent stress response